MSNSYRKYERVWIRHIRQGDHYAFEALFKEYYRPLSRFAWRYVESRSGAEELVQDLFADLWEKREELVIEGALRPYLYRAVRNRALNAIKREKRESEYATRWKETIEPVDEMKIEHFESEQERQRRIQQMIGEAIEELPPRSRMTYKLHRYDGLTYEEIAEVMNVSVKTVESQMTRTLQILRKRLSSLLPYLLVTLMVG
ncbi:MAG: RNA polymerase sigma-70 factor [Balneolaceae bacterium]